METFGRHQHLTQSHTKAPAALGTLGSVNVAFYGDAMVSRDRDTNLNSDAKPLDSKDLLEPSSSTPFDWNEFLRERMMWIKRVAIWGPGLATIYGISQLRSFRGFRGNHEVTLSQLKR